MKKTFRSKIELALFVPVILVALISGILFALNHLWAGVVLTAAVVLFIAYLVYDTSYELTPDLKLRIKSGFLFHKEIYVNSIKKIRFTRNIHASPALSSDRIQILYNRYGTILISPRDKSEFVNELRKRNPRITILQ